MIPGEPSRTALAAAAHRALHQALDRPGVFEDPLAAALLTREETAAAALLGGRAMRAFICARARLAEDALAAAVRRGTDQYLILGAGLDTFAGRNPHPGLRVFEADHPATQAAKRARLQDRPWPARFIGLDLDGRSLAQALSAGGLDPARPVFVSWLGVTPYLDREVVFETLRALAAWPGGIELVFDYGPAPQTLGGALRAAYQRRAARLAAAGEPWLTGFAPDDLAERLPALGLGRVEDLGPEAINDLHFAHRTDGLRVLAGRIVRARP